MYWQIEYDINWFPICEICGKSFKKLSSHVVQKHSLTWREYKIKYWLNIKKWICFEWTINKLRENIKNNYDLVVVDNLLNKWKKSRFVKWELKWKKKEYVSEQTKKMLRDNIKKIINNN